MVGPPTSLYLAPHFSVRADGPAQKYSTVLVVICLVISTNKRKSFETFKVWSN